MDKKEFFNRLPKEEQWSVIKTLLGYQLQIAVAKNTGTASVSAISAAMLVVSTLNKKLINLDISSAKIILSILLFTIPLSLTAFLLDVEKGAIGNRKHIEEYLGKIDTNPSFIDYVISYIPIVIVITYYIIVFYLVYVIWR